VSSHLTGVMSDCATAFAGRDSLHDEKGRLMPLVKDARGREEGALYWRVLSKATRSGMLFMPWKRSPALTAAWRWAVARNHIDVRDARRQGPDINNVKSRWTGLYFAVLTVVDYSSNFWTVATTSLYTQVKFEV
jgi:hypothetical protein